MAAKIAVLTLHERPRASESSSEPDIMFNGMALFVLLMHSQHGNKNNHLVLVAARKQFKHVVRQCSPRSAE